LQTHLIESHPEAPLDWHIVKSEKPLDFFFAKEGELTVEGGIEIMVSFIFFLPSEGVSV
jgi:hypothetical protein